MNLNKIYKNLIIRSSSKNWHEIYTCSKRNENVPVVAASVVVIVVATVVAITETIAITVVVPSGVADIRGCSLSQAQEDQRAGGLEVRKRHHLLILFNL